MIIEYPVGDLVRVSRAARLLGLSAAMVRVLADSGRLPCIRLERERFFNESDVLKLRDERTAESGR
jgi:DNA-binding transcriptional MerR regulator